MFKMKKILLFLTILAVAAGTLYSQNTIKRETMVYSVKDGKELLLDRYTCESPGQEGKRPVFIYVHGGGFSTGSRVNALQIQYCKHFAKQGFVSVAINYRLGIPQGVQADQLTIMKAISLACEDLADATAFILGKTDEWNIDPGKIVISGGSAGAITCLCTEYDICSDRNYTGRLPEGFNYAGVISHAGAVIIPADTLVWKKEPCPVLLMHGNKDQMVPFDRVLISENLYAGSNYLHKQFVGMKHPHWLYEEAGADHIVALKPLQYNFAETDSFIERFVMNQEEAVVHTVWEDETPDSMQDMIKVVPLYINGWDKTDDEINQ